ncbi:unconventional myosin-Ig-like, partial [Protobothrops mucrosquamatus]|uniref:unconventional myosin-Ig-like n=1 Tax=Protobothrops mucrosquamatus TaxID=103944 RepID=UPI000775DF2B
PPAVLAQFQETSKVIFCRWRARQLVTNIPPSEMGQIKAKVAAYDVLQGRRTNWGCCRNWRQNYLASAEENAALAPQFVKQVSALKDKMHFSAVLFSGHVRKVNRCNKRTDRALLITDQHLYKLDPRKQYRVKKAIALSKVSGLSVTSGEDQLVVFHLEKQKALVVCLHRTQPADENRAGELVGVLVDHFRRLKRDLHVTVTDRIPLSQNSRKRLVTVETRADMTLPDFAKTRDGFVLYWPRS